MRGESFDGRYFSFPVVDVADSLGASTGIVKREISALKWKQTGIGGTCTLYLLHYQRENKHYFYET